MAKCIVSIKNSTDRDYIKSEILHLGGNIISDLKYLPTLVIADVSDVVFSVLKNNNKVAFIEWDEEGVLSTIQNITVDDNWGLDRIDQNDLPLTKQYKYIRTGFNVDIYVFDSGINYDHIEVIGRSEFLYDGVNNLIYPNGTDGFGHGTGVSSIAAGVKYGVAKLSKIYSVKIANSKGAIFSSDFIGGVNEVIAHHTTKVIGLIPRPSVVNMSLGGFKSQSIDVAVDSLIDAGVVVVAAAGNFSVDSSTTSPARVQDVITVGAIDQLDQYAYFSNYGPKVDIFAPGVEVLGAYPFDLDSITLTFNSGYGNTVGLIPANKKLRTIEIHVIEAFDDFPTLKIGYANNPVLVNIGYSKLKSQGYQNTYTINLILNENNETPIVALFDKKSATKGLATITLKTDKTSNSKSIPLTGTSFACPHVAGVVALKLEEEPAPFTSRAEVVAVKNFIIDSATKNKITQLPNETPNRILFSPWIKSDTVEWITNPNTVIEINEGENILFAVEAVYYDDLGRLTTDVEYSIINSPNWGINEVSLDIDTNTGELIWLGTAPFLIQDETHQFTIQATNISSGAFSTLTLALTVLEVGNRPPNWINPSEFSLPARGNITVLPGATENIVYTPFDLYALDPDTGVEVAGYEKISGNLPNGLTINPITGVISGTPIDNILISLDYVFVVRATDIEGGFTDRTFSIFLVAQETAPFWITPAGSIGIANNDTAFTFQLQAGDLDNDTIFYTMVSGSLPAGLTLTTNGLISGIPFDTTGIYNFGVEVSDTVLGTIRSFSIELQPALLSTPPTWITPAGVLGTIDENSPSSFILQATDIDGDPITFSLSLIVGESFPAGLILNSTGTITGIADPVSIDTTHTFTASISDGVNPPVNRTFSITVKNVTGIVPPIWITPAGSLGSLWEFYPSTFIVEASDPNGLTLTYAIVDGSLPSGLTLNLANGLIVGFPDTVSFDQIFNFTISADNGSFSVNRAFSITILNLIGVPVTKIVADRITGINRLKIAEFVSTTLIKPEYTDLLYRQGDPQFSIPESLNIYMAEGLPIFPPGSPVTSNPADEFYRIINDDPRPENTAALQINKNNDQNDPIDTSNKRHLSGHYHKVNLLLGDIKTAHARDKFTGDILYDVIYIEVVDPQQNSSFRPDLVTYNPSVGAGVGAETPDGSPDPGVAYPPQYKDPYQNPIMPTPIITHPVFDSQYDSTVLNSGNFPTSTNDTFGQAIPRNTESLDFITPNSLKNMRDHIISGYGGFVDDIELLPLWMGTPQEVSNPGSAIGWVPAVPLAYVLPNTSETIVNGLTQADKDYLKGYPFIIDRHLVYTTPILTPTTTFSDPVWVNGINFVNKSDHLIFDGNTSTFDNDTTQFWEIILLTTFDTETTTFDINNSPLYTINFTELFGVTTFDGVGIELYNKYIKFPPGDKYWDANTNTVVNKLKKQMPATDTEN